MFEVSKADEVLIELTQKMQRLPGVDRETIGFTIMQVSRSSICQLCSPGGSTVHGGRRFLLFQR